MANKRKYDTSLYYFKVIDEDGDEVRVFNTMLYYRDPISSHNILLRRMNNWIKQFNKYLAIEFVEIYNNVGDYKDTIEICMIKKT